MKKIISVIMCAVLTISTFTIALNYDIKYTYAATYEQELIKKGFPESYAKSLSKLHSKYPEWVFVPLKTGLNWDNAVNGERKQHRQQLIEKVTSIYPEAYFCNCSTCYVNGKYRVWEGSNWVAASKQAVEYYLDPRNSLDEMHIFQFESTSYNSSQTQSGVEAIIDGTWMHNSTISYNDKNGKTKTINEKYSSVIMDAAKTHKMSAYYLASKIVQEVGVGSKKPTAAGASGTNSTYPGIYNYYNIGANTGALDGLRWASTPSNSYYVYSGSNSKVNIREKASTSSNLLVSVPSYTVVTYVSATSKQSDGYVWHKITVTYSGKTYTGYVRDDLLDKTTDSYNRPWTDPKLSITNGAKYIANNFKTQTSGYLQKFNVNPASPYLHQHEYMANVSAATTEAEKTYNAYKSMDKLSTAKTFEIPVFENMPDKDMPSDTVLTEAIGVAKGFDIYWTKSEKATGYELEYATKSDFSNSAIKDLGNPSTLSKTITGRAENKEYYLRVRAYNKVNSSNCIYGNWSKTVKVKTTSATSPPSSTRLLQVDQQLNGFSASWVKISDAAGYELQYGTKADFSNALTVDSKSNKNSLSVTDRPEWVKYNVRVRAYKVINGSKSYGSWSEAQTVTTFGKPKASAITQVEGVYKGFCLSWTKSNKATGYELEYATKSSFSNGAIITAGGIDDTSLNLTGRASEKTYYLRIRGYNELNGEKIYGDWSEAASVTTCKEVSNLKVSSRSTASLKLSWSGSTDASGYQLQRKNGDSYKTLKNTTSKSYTDSKLTAGTVYNYRVRAYKTLDGVKYYGAWKTLKTTTKPNKVTINNPTSQSGQKITAKWSKVSGGATGYQIYWAKDKSFSNVIAKTTVSGSSKTSYTGKNFTKGSTYYIKVRAYKTLNNVTYYGEWSNTKSIKAK